MSFVLSSQILFPPPPAPAPIAGYAHRWKVSDLALSDNDPVVSWIDEVAAVDATNVGSPTFKTGITPTGMPVVRFNGSLDRLVSSSISGAKHIFCVAKRQAGPDTDEALISIGGNYFWYADGTSFPFSSSFGSARRDGAATNLVSGAAFCVYSIDLDVSGAVSGAVHFANDRGNAPACGQWDICELIIYNTSLVPADIIHNEAYLDEVYITP
jgi:hypothetical protein